MENIYVLKELYFLDPMHDQSIDLIEINEEKLIFYYNNLHYYEINYEDGISNKYFMEHKDYTSCKVVLLADRKDMQK